MRRAVLLTLVTTSLATGATGCLGEQTYDLDDIANEMDASVYMNVGNMEKDYPPVGTLFVSFSEPDHGCFFLDSSARVEVDGVRATSFVREGISHAGCDGVGFRLDGIPPVKDVSEVVLVDDSARLVIRQARMLANVQLAVTGALQRGTKASIQVVDPRPVQYPRVRWTPSGSTVADWEVTGSTDAPGEIRFDVPANAVTGSGTLHVSVDMYEWSGPSPSLCPDIERCGVDANAAADLPATVQ